MLSLIRSRSKSKSWSLSVSTSYSRSKSRSTPDINKLHAKRGVLRFVWQNFTVQKDSHGGNLRTGMRSCHTTWLQTPHPAGFLCCAGWGPGHTATLR